MKKKESVEINIRPVNNKYKWHINFLSKDKGACASGSEETVIEALKAVANLCHKPIKSKPSKKEIDAFGKQLLEWLYSDPERAHRLDHEGSGNW